MAKTRRRLGCAWVLDPIEDLGDPGPQRPSLLDGDPEAVWGLLDATFDSVRKTDTPERARMLAELAAETADRHEGRPDADLP